MTDQLKPETVDAAPLKCRVLLAEDSPFNVAIMTAFLKDDRIELTVSTNGEKAVQAFKQGVFDLVLMDIQMPVLDGCEAALAIRRWEIDHSFSSTPITALTALSAGDDLSRIFASGCSNYLPKPISRTMLLQAVRQSFDLARISDPALSASR